MVEPKAVYKKKVRREAMRISVALISFYAVNIIVTAVITALFMYFNGLLSVPYDEAYASLPWGWLSIAGLFSGSFMLLIVRGTRLFTHDLTKTANKINIPDYLKLIALVLGINAVISVGQMLITMLLQNNGVSTNNAEDVFSLYYMNIPGLLYVVLLGPILEEIIFRGAILRALEPFGKNFAIVVSALLFGLYHLSLFQGIFAFFIGLVLAYTAMRFSIKWSMLLHILNNAFAMLITYFYVSDGITLGIYLVFLGLAVLSVVLGFGRLKDQLRLGKPTPLHFAAKVPVIPSNFVPWDPSFAGYIANQIAVRARPFARFFSSAWVIVAISLATVITLISTFAT